MFANCGFRLHLAVPQAVRWFTWEVATPWSGGSGLMLRFLGRATSGSRGCRGGSVSTVLEMEVRLRAVPIGLALLQLVDAAGNELVPRRAVASHLDHLGVPVVLRPALPWIK